MTTSYEKILKENAELRLIRLRLHRYCSPKVLARVTQDNLVMVAPYIYPMEIAEFRELVSSDRMLWYFMFTPNSDLLPLEEARAAAAKVLTDALDVGKRIDKEDAPGYKLQLDAAKAILDRTEIKFEGDSDLTPVDLAKLIPRKLKEASIEEMKDKLAKVKSHTKA